jgi:hypothetical protein
LFAHDLFSGLPSPAGVDLRVDGGTIARYWRWNPGVREIM